MHVHIVQKGDTLWKISRQYGVPFEEVKRLNAHLANPDYIVPGMKIFLPDHAKKGKGKPPAEHPYKDGRPKKPVREKKEMESSELTPAPPPPPMKKPAPKPAPPKPAPKPAPPKPAPKPVPKPAPKPAPMPAPPPMMPIEESPMAPPPPPPPPPMKEESPMAPPPVMPEMEMPPMQQPCPPEKEAAIPMMMPFCCMPVFDMCCQMCGHMPTHHHMMPQHHMMHHPHMMQPYPQMEHYPQAQPYPAMPHMPAAPGYTLPIAEGMPEYAMPAEQESPERGWKMEESSSCSSSLDVYMGSRQEQESPMDEELHVPQAPMHMYPAESQGDCGCGGGSAVPYAVQAAAWPYWPQPGFQPYPGHGHHHGHSCHVCGSPFGYGGY